MIRRSTRNYFVGSDTVARSLYDTDQAQVTVEQYFELSIDKNYILEGSNIASKW